VFVLISNPSRTMNKSWKVAIFVVFVFFISNSIAQVNPGPGNYFVDCIKPDGELPCTNANDVIIDSFSVTDVNGNPISCVSCSDGLATAYLKIIYHKNAASDRYNVFAVFWVDQNDNGAYDPGEEFRFCLDSTLSDNNPHVAVIPISWTCGKDLVLRGDRDLSKEEGPRVTWEDPTGSPTCDECITCLKSGCHQAGKWNNNTMHRHSTIFCHMSGNSSNTADVYR